MQCVLRDIYVKPQFAYDSRGAIGVPTEHAVNNLLVWFIYADLVQAASLSLRSLKLRISSLLTIHTSNIDTARVFARHERDPLGARLKLPFTPLEGGQ
jgi:hypothetical protein